MTAALAIRFHTCASFQEKLRQLVCKLQATKRAPIGALSYSMNRTRGKF
jgi:hypothetical protein